MGQVRDGVAPDEFLYGFPCIDRTRFDVRYVEDAHPFATLPEKLVQPLQGVFGRRYSIGFNFHAYLKNRRQVQRADVLVTTVDGYGLPVAWRKSAGRVKGRLVYVCQGIYTVAERARTNKMDALVRRFVGRWLRSADRVVVLGEGDLAAVRRAMPEISPERMRIIQFGVDTAFWRPAEAAPKNDEPEPYILSVGSDFLRDYDTLLDAVGSTHRLRLVTRLPINRMAGANVTVGGDADWLQLRELFRGAEFTVTPVKNAPRDSGHSATLQAMACGKAVILSNTPGLWDRGHMRHLETCYLVEPENPLALREAIENLASDPDLCRRLGHNARQLVEQRYSSRAFGQRLQQVIEEIVD